MRIQSTDRRERIWSELEAATGENTTAGALDVAATYYLEMRGDNQVRPTGAIPELLERAADQGSLTAEEIAEILDVDELPVAAGTSYSYGRD